jgi:hypothetical protein
MASHSADAEALSLCPIIAVAYVSSCAVSRRPASWARSSSAARMSTLTMLAVSKAASPHTAPAPEPTSRTATDTFAPSGTATDAGAAARTAS